MLCSKQTILCIPLLYLFIFVLIKSELINHCIKLTCKIVFTLNTNYYGAKR